VGGTINIFKGKNEKTHEWYLEEMKNNQEKSYALLKRISLFLSLYLRNITIFEDSQLLI